MADKMTAAEAREAPIEEVAAALMQQFNVEMNPDSEPEEVIRAKFLELANAESAGVPAAPQKPLDECTIPELREVAASKGVTIPKEVTKKADILALVKGDGSSSATKDKKLGRVNEDGYVEYHPAHDKRVWIRIALEKDMPEEHSFGLNGFPFRIKRGKWVNVPESLLNGPIKDARESFYEDGKLKTKPRFNVEVHHGDKPPVDDG